MHLIVIREAQVWQSLYVTANKAITFSQALLDLETLKWYCSSNNSHLNEVILCPLLDRPLKLINELLNHPNRTLPNPQILKKRIFKLIILLKFCDLYRHTVKNV